MEDKDWETLLTQSAQELEISYMAREIATEVLKILEDNKWIDNKN